MAGTSFKSLEGFLPPHKGSLHLIHNDHRTCYQTVEQWEEALKLASSAALGWVSEEQRVKAIATNSVWELQWYPDTPVGFCRLLACDLEVLLERSNEMASQEAPE